MGWIGTGIYRIFNTFYCLISDNSFLQFSTNIVLCIFNNGHKGCFHYVRFAHAGGVGFESRKCFNSQGELNNARSARAGKADVMENSLK